MARKATDTIQLKLRFSEALRRRLERAADAHDLSMNSEIVRRLEESFRREDTEQKFAEVAKRTAEEILSDPHLRRAHDRDEDLRLTHLAGPPDDHRPDLHEELEGIRTQLEKVYDLMTQQQGKGK